MTVLLFVAGVALAVRGAHVWDLPALLVVVFGVAKLLSDRKTRA